LSACEGTECIGTPIHLGFARRFDEATPRTWNPVERSVRQIGSALVLDPAEKVQGLQHGLPCRGPLKRDGSHHRGQKTSPTVVALNEFSVIGVVGRPSQQFHLGASLEEALTRHACTGLRPYRSSLNPLVQPDLQGLPQLSGGGIQVMQGPQPCLFTCVMGSPDDIGDQEITHVHGIVHGRALTGLSQGREGGRAPLGSHTSDGLSLCCGAVASEGAKAMERQVFTSKVTDAKRPDLREPMSSSNECRATDTRGRASQPIQRR
jgi:hypothetical protein